MNNLNRKVRARQCQIFIINKNECLLVDVTCFPPLTGWVFIDRCGKHFGTILNFLRDGSVPLPETCVEISEILAETKYYGISELSDACEQALRRKMNENTNITWVTLITSQNETQKLISISSKVCIVLSISYCLEHLFFLIIIS